MSIRKQGLRFAARLWNRWIPPREPRDCILVYHSVHPDLPYQTCTPPQFREHLEWLSAHCELLPLPDLLQPRTGNSLRPRVAITFDDGYADNYHHAFPLLHEFRVPATFFVTAGYIDRDPVVLARFQKLRRTQPGALVPMAWDQLREMATSGMDIGCHTYSHPNLHHLSEADAEFEMAHSKQLIEQRLGRAVQAHAYPFGKPGCTMGSRDAQSAERLGYMYALTTVKRALRPGDSPWRLPRLLIGRAYPLQEQIAGLWDCIGVYNERAPTWIARALSPRGFRASTYGGSYNELARASPGGRSR